MERVLFHQPLLAEAHRIGYIHVRDAELLPNLHIAHHAREQPAGLREAQDTVGLAAMVEDGLTRVDAARDRLLRRRGLLLLLLLPSILVARVCCGASSVARVERGAEAGQQMLWG